MAGSIHSGQEMQSGRTNRAEDRTIVWAQTKPGGNYDGAAILIVEAAHDAEDPDEYEEGQDWSPNQNLDAIQGFGYSYGGLVFSTQPGGTGVLGVGGANQGTGVVGFGGGARHGPHVGQGTGGIGVHGFGGSIEDFFTLPSTPPGSGVLAQGGRFNGNNALREMHGTGLIAIAGSRNADPLPPLSDAGSIGVFAVGADAELTQKTDPEDSTKKMLSGPDAPGAGVLGRGGSWGGTRDPRPGWSGVAVGVIGLAGGVPIPKYDVTGNSGVYGGGPTGVLGLGSRDAGVHGKGTNDSRGGMFGSAKSAQVNLTPNKAPAPLPAKVSITPDAIQLREEGLGLPAKGLAGDLMTVLDRDQATLWFCVQSFSGGTPARWAQVLLGYEFPGNA